MSVPSSCGSKFSTHTSRRRDFLRGAAGFCALAATPFAYALGKQPLHSKSIYALGTRVIFLLRHDDRRAAQQAMGRAVADIFMVHQTMTRYEPSPLTSLNGGDHRKALVVPGEMFTVIEKSQEIMADSGGLFDITIGSQTALHHGKKLEHRAVGSRFLECHRQKRSVRLGHPDTALDLDSIAKGYAVDRAAATLRRYGIQDFLINAGGDLYARGNASTDSKGWQIRVKRQQPTKTPEITLQVVNRAVATSGNYVQNEQVVRHRQCHLINPTSGRCAEGLSSATLLAPSALQADAWATAAYVGGVSTTQKLLSQKQQLQAVLIRADGSVVRV